MNDILKEILMRSVICDTTFSYVCRTYQVKLVMDDSFFDYELLKEALGKKSEMIVHFLISKGCRVKNPNKINSETPLHLAMKLENLSIITKLLNKGASIYDKNHRRETPLQAAFNDKNYSAVDKVFDYISNCCFINPDPTDKDDIIHFHIACIRNHQNSVTLYLACKFDVNSFISLNSAEFSGLNPLHYVVSKNYFKLFKILLDHNGDLSIKNNRGLTPLHIIYYNFYDTCESVKYNESYSFDQNGEYKTMIREAFIYGNSTKFINSVDEHGVSHFHLCCSTDYSNFIQIFINDGADVNSCISSNCSINPGFTPLHFAVQNASAEIVDLLLKNGADCNRTDKFGLTPLHLVCKRCGTCEQVKIIKKLLEYKACPITVNENGYAPIHYAFNNLFKLNLLTDSNDEGKVIFDLLISHVPLDINLVDNEGISLFHMACTRNDINQVNDFLNAGAIIDSRVLSGKYRGYTALHFAVLFNQKDVVEVLLKRNAQVNIKTSQTKSTPLHLACEYRWIKFYELNTLYKLEKSMDNQVSLDWISNRQSQFDIIKLLLLHGAHVDSKDSSGLTPLFVACRVNEHDYCKLDWSASFKIMLIAEMNIRVKMICEILLSNTANIKACAKKQTSILHFISKSHLLKISDELIEYLIAAGADIHAIDDAGLTPLHIAVKYNQKELALTLLKHNADVNAKSRNCKPPLHIAILKYIQCGCTSYYSGNKRDINNQLCDILLENGSDINNKDENGKTVLHHAISGFETFLIEKLLSYGADINVEDALGNSTICSLPKCNDQTSRTGKTIAWMADFIWHEYDEVSSVIFTHVQKLLALGLCVSDKVHRVCFKVRKYYESKQIVPDCIRNLDNMFDECTEELNRMKLVQLDNNTSLYDILKMDSQDLTKYVKNGSLINVLELWNVYKEFPLYSYLIKLQLKRGLIRIDVLNSARRSLTDAMGFCAPDVYNSILMHLNNDEIANLNAAITQDRIIENKMIID